MQSERPSKCVRESRSTIHHSLDIACGFCRGTGGKPALGPSWALFPSVRVLLAVQDRDDNTTSYTATILSAVGQVSFCF